jgi:hypothetical protein
MCIPKGTPSQQQLDARTFVQRFGCLCGGGYKVRAMKRRETHCALNALPIQPNAFDLPLVLAGIHNLKHGILHVNNGVMTTTVLQMSECHTRTAGQT